jgi:hypothetical protein
LKLFRYAPPFPVLFSVRVGKPGAARKPREGSVAAVRRGAQKCAHIRMRVVWVALIPARPSLARFPLFTAVVL